MKDDIKATWIADLRSGEFIQTQGRLIKAYIDGEAKVLGHCCLGVLVDQAIRSGTCEYVRYKPGSNGTEVEILNEASFEWEEFTDNDLPREVAEWAGIVDQSSNPNVGDVTLIRLNDDVPEANFSEIADAIEKHL